MSFYACIYCLHWQIHRSFARKIINFSAASLLCHFYCSLIKLRIFFFTIILYQVLRNSETLWLSFNVKKSIARSHQLFFSKFALSFLLLINQIYIFFLTIILPSFKNILYTLCIGSHFIYIYYVKKSIAWSQGRSSIFTLASLPWHIQYFLLRQLIFFQSWTSLRNILDTLCFLLLRCTYLIQVHWQIIRSIARKTLNFSLSNLRVFFTSFFSYQVSRIFFIHLVQSFT